MIPTEDEEVLRIFDLVCEQQAYRLQGLLSSIDVVSQEEVVCLWGESSVFEET